MFHYWLRVRHNVILQKKRKSLDKVVCGSDSLANSSVAPAQSESAVVMMEQKHRSWGLIPKGETHRYHRPDLATCSWAPAVSLGAALLLLHHLERQKNNNSQRLLESTCRRKKGAFKCESGPWPLTPTW